MIIKGTGLFHKKLVPCSIEGCDHLIPRGRGVKHPVCFDCKKKKNREYSRDRYFKKKLSPKAA